MCVWTWCLLLSAWSWIACPTVQAAATSAAKAPTADQAPTTITSQTMTVSNQDNQAIFDGNVVLTRGALVVHSDHMVVSFYAGRSGAAAGDRQAPRAGGKSTSKPGKDAAPSVSDRSIRMVEATGHVRIEKDDGRATCRKAIYYEDEKKIILTGEPVAWQKGTRVSGKRIIMYIEEDRSVVEGDSQVVIEGEAGRKP